ncbi:MAG: hypothetical protein LAQ30_25885 [Acidobacteriia bacterium]|nr:hypothetical protein [Terriglobia bacterium]
MSEIPVNRILRALTRKGFARRDRHHIILWVAPQGRHPAVATRISHGQRSANDWLLARIARELSLSKRELLSFIECELSEAAYLDLMIQRGHVQPA